MSKSHESYPKTLAEKRTYKKFRQERQDTAELREKFERENARFEAELAKYLRLKGELE